MRRQRRRMSYTVTWGRCPEHGRVEGTWEDLSFSHAFGTHHDGFFACPECGEGLTDLEEFWVERED
jgi:hypothetical protein